MFQFYFDLTESIPSFTDWIQAISALIIVFFTWKMKNYAKEALNTWKEDKYDSYIIDAELVLPEMTKVLMHLSFFIRTEILTNDSEKYLPKITESFNDAYEKIKQLDLNGHHLKLSKIDNNEITIKKTIDEYKVYFNKIRSIIALTIIKNADYSANTKSETYSKYYNELSVLTSDFVTNEPN
ncbi:hypothetical protein [Sphingobacterium cavernae]|uniref:hypothetical protein n=1 Tax=Sphingobacterium cavernae TaxID=2592657 RepID=UPI001230069F|nr:hypothetical protein [Sphingobacterium cavernae]